MSASRIIEVADAIVEELNEDVAPFDNNGDDLPEPQFIAQRVYGAELKNTELSRPVVTVRHPLVTSEQESRGGTEDHYGIEIVLQVMVDPNDRDEIDRLVVLARRIARYYPVTKGSQATADLDLIVSAVEHAVFNPDLLAQGRFFSAIALTLLDYPDMD